MGRVSCRVSRSGPYLRVVRMTKNKYQDMLRHPLWLKKREEILQRDRYRCVRCGRKRYLRVHHLQYHTNKAPWEYDNKDLSTVCDICHSAMHWKEMPPARRKALKMTKKKWRKQNEYARKMMPRIYAEMEKLDNEYRAIVEGGAQ